MSCLLIVRRLLEYNRVKEYDEIFTTEGCGEEMAYLQLDFQEAALARICERLQLTNTQNEAAAKSYGAVGDWLGEAGLLARFNPRIFPQGSMALGTTVKPRGRVEYDLDMVLEIDPIDVTPAWLYEAVFRRLSENGRYRPKRFPRCLRIEYERQFHLDIVPARTHPEFGPTFIEIPEAPERGDGLHKWKISNPKGFIEWFENQCAKARQFGLILEKARREPFPEPVLVHAKPALTRAVQLMKRHRDVVYRGTEDAPSSIILTTLAGTFYQGEGSIEQTLIGVLEKIIDTTTSDPRLTTLENPSTSERLCSKWTAQQGLRFAQFARRFHDRLVALRTAEGIHNIGAELKSMFGDETAAGTDIVSKAITEYIHEFNEARQTGNLRFTKSGLTTVGGTTIKKHSFYGREGGK